MIWYESLAVGFGAFCVVWQIGLLWVHWHEIDD